MKRKILFLVALTMFVFSSTLASAGGEAIKGLKLRSGHIVYGRIIMATPERVIIEKGGSFLTYRLGEVEAFIKEDEKSDEKNSKIYR